MGDQDHIVLSGSPFDFNQSVFFQNVDGLDASLAIILEGSQFGLLDRPILRGKNQEAGLFPSDVLLVFIHDRFHTNQRGHFFIRLELQHIGNVSSLAGAAQFRKFVHTLDINPSRVGEKHQVVMGAGREEMFDKVLVLTIHHSFGTHAHANDAFPSPTL